jgi:uncharacterized protein YjlB
LLAIGELGRVSLPLRARAEDGWTLSERPPVQTPRVCAHVLADDGSIPNSRLPLLIYAGALDLIGEDPCGAVEATLRTHGWGHGWRNGILLYHHYHSTAHEALVAYSGSARVQFGGEQGIAATVNPGDVVIIPAGVGHKNLAASADFRVIGAYPSGQAWDICYGKPGERPRADQNIARVALPTADPLFGQDGPLRTYWR